MTGATIAIALSFLSLLPFLRRRIKLKTVQLFFKRKGVSAPRRPGYERALLQSVRVVTGFLSGPQRSQDHNKHTANTHTLWSNAPECFQL